MAAREIWLERYDSFCLKIRTMCNVMEFEKSAPFF